MRVLRCDVCGKTADDPRGMANDAARYEFFDRTSPLPGSPAVITDRKAQEGNAMSDDIAHEDSCMVVDRDVVCTCGATARVVAENERLRQQVEAVWGVEKALSGAIEDAGDGARSVIDAITVRDSLRSALLGAPEPQNRETR